MIDAKYFEAQANEWESYVLKQFDNIKQNFTQLDAWLSKCIEDAKNNPAQEEILSQLKGPNQGL